MFCTGAAPTVPGISARFSSPGQPRSIVCSTTSCQVIPAPASTMKASGRSSTRRRPVTSTFSTRSSTSRVNTRLLPPPSTSLARRPTSGESSTRRTSASQRIRARRRACAGRPKVFKAFNETSDSSQGAEDMAEFSPIPAPTLARSSDIPMPSFDAVLEPDMVAIKHSVENTRKEIGTRFDFKGTSAAVELKEKDKEIQLVGDGDFQIEQISTVLIGKLTKQGVTVNYLDMSAKIEKIGGDKVRQAYKIKAGIDSTLAKKIVTAIKDSKLKVQAS